MQVVKKAPEYTIYKKRSGRFGVLDKNKQWIRGDDKVKILVAAKLLKVKLPKAKPKKEEPPAEAEAASESEEKKEE